MNSKIQLRPFRWSLAKPLYELIKVPEVHQYLDLVVNTYDNYEKWLEKIEWLEFMGDTVHRTIWNEKQQIMGEIYLINIDREKKSAEMGTWIGHNFWGNGYNQLIKEKVLEEAFTQVNLETILFFIQKANRRAIDSLMRLPYVTSDMDVSYEKLIKYKEYKTGRPIQLLVVKKEDFFQSS